ncbi:hypothetical protein GTY57_29480 [Streptomyces sp. SID5475]|uniref:hypothetical protein n=1 Tax=Streptomyces sp. S07_1.15 TaxID=2873925 RepID=UPI00059263FE|nr:hypothetical protein [Streptomyces sp. S07_1.15]MCC3655728.1 hypothetical protein [Streptomyces sp. S07_1.15]MZE80932.1 hypothetical protein [Streptomyces sp. SID5475]
MEIEIRNGIVRKVDGGVSAPNTPQAIKARTIANELPLNCVRAGAKIVHNADAPYTGIRFETRAGAVILEMPANLGDSVRVIHERITPPEDPEPVNPVQIARWESYKPKGIALMVGELLRSRGFLS